MDTEKTIKKLNADFRRDKSGAFHLVEPTSDLKEINYKARSDYKSVLMKLLIKTASRLQTLGVPVSISINESRKVA